jgi:hypothetical protein
MVGEYCMVHPKVIDYFMMDEGAVSINTGIFCFFCLILFVFFFFYDSRWYAILMCVDLKIDIDNKQLLDLMSGWEGGSADCCRIVCTHTYVKVELQDGTITEWLPATALIARYVALLFFFPNYLRFVVVVLVIAFLIRRDQLLDADFWPADFIVKKEDGVQNDKEDEEDAHGGNPNDPLKKKKKVGMVCRVNNTEQTAIVKWKRPGKRRRTKEEEVSVYAITDHSTYTYRLGSMLLYLFATFYCCSLLRLFIVFFFFFCCAIAFH